MLEWALRSAASKKAVCNIPFLNYCEQIHPEKLHLQRELILFQSKIKLRSVCIYRRDPPATGIHHQTVGPLGGGPTGTQKNERFQWACTFCCVYSNSLYFISTDCKTAFPTCERLNTNIFHSAKTWISHRRGRPKTEEEMLHSIKTFM